MTKHMDLRGLDAAEPFAPATIVDVDALEKYAVRWARNPAKGSAFFWMMMFLWWMPDQMLLSTLRALRYGGIVLIHNRRPMGHAFYQMHDGGECHVFSIYVDASLRLQGYAERLSQALVEEMARRDHVRYVRLGAGGDAIITRIWEKIRCRDLALECELDVCDRPGIGWLKLSR